MRTWPWLVVIAAGCGDVDLERMIDQPRKDSYAPSTLFENGTVMQHAPPGTVHRAQLIGPPELLEGAVDGRYVEAIPLDVDAALLARGRDRFDHFCAVCHGADGHAETKVARLMRRPPASLHTEEIRGYPAGKIFYTITVGYGMMPSYAARLAVPDRWAVVAYVQALQLSQHAHLDRLPAEMRQEAEPWLR